MCIRDRRCTANEGYQLVSTTVTINRHGVTYDFGTLDDVPQGTAYISTRAYDPVDGDSRVAVGTVAVADKVTYSGLVMGGSYRLVTTVVDAATGEAITVDGQTVTASHDFTCLLFTSLRRQRAEREDEPGPHLRGGAASRPPRREVL